MHATPQIPTPRVVWRGGGVFLTLSSLLVFGAQHPLPAPGEWRLPKRMDMEGHERPLWCLPSTLRLCFFIVTQIFLGNFDLDPQFPFACLTSTFCFS